MIDYAKLAGKDIVGLSPYIPGKPVKELERELGIAKAIKLASNENPLGPSPLAIKAVADFLPEMSRYPFGDAHDIRTALAAKLGINPDTLIFGAGSNEIIELALRTFVSPGEHVMSAAPSFSVYGIISQAMRSFCKWIPVKKDFSFDFEAMEKAIDDKTRIIFLCNPNNPTGAYFTQAQADEFMAKVPSDTIVVMDEAYCEYADAPDFPDSLKMQKKYPNIMIMRTFSKAYGLAALRIGYCIADKTAIDMMNRVRQPFNTNMAAQVAAVAALADTDHLKEVILENHMGKIYLYDEFKKLGLEYVPTQSNFILVKTGNGEKVFNDLLRKGVIVRYLGASLKDFIRVSIGTEEENIFFIEQLKKVL